MGPGPEVNGMVERRGGAGLRFKAVFFDAVGTLFETRGSVGEIYWKVAQDYGANTTPDLLQRAFLRAFQQAEPVPHAESRMWWRDVVYRAFNEVGMIRNFDSFFDNIYELFRGSKGWILFPDTEPALRTLRKDGFRLGIVSNFDSRLPDLLAELGIKSLFDIVIIPETAGAAKPERRIFLTAVDSLGLAAGQAVFVGDSVSDDVIGSSRAGLQPVLIDRRNHHAGAEQPPRICSLDELPALLERLDKNPS